MPIVRFASPNGVIHSVNAAAGTSAMEAARDADIPGIEAECGGSRSCATCHVYVSPVWLPLTGPAEGEERELLELVEAPRAESRLSCQVFLSDVLDGLEISIPLTQGFA